MVYATKVTQNNKNKAKNLNHIKYYIYKQKNHYTNNYLKNLKTSISLSNFYINNYKKKLN